MSKTASLYVSQFSLQGWYISIWDTLYDTYIGLAILCYESRTKKMAFFRGKIDIFGGGRSDTLRLFPLGIPQGIRLPKEADDPGGDEDGHLYGSSGDRACDHRPGYVLSLIHI